ncbi:hypothetical protein QZL74_16480 [Burkholderia gladioli pv. alliicola]|uniref:hypothetical protein n=1 Tax=Burkholderia gladioli TaxID=28095 RepID=UPI003D818F69
MDESNAVDEIPDGEEARRAARFPAISSSAEYLVMGYLLRRNVLTYKAPPMNEGYDLICIHPDPRKASRQLRVQVKSRYATDCDRGFPVKERSINAFDFLVVAFLNVGYYLSEAKKHAAIDGGGGAGVLCVDARVYSHAPPQKRRVGNIRCRLLRSSPDLIYGACSITNCG